MKKRSAPVRFTGQHFTIDPVLIKDAIRLADIQKEDIILDIGAGLGFLTVHLIKHSERVIAIENDIYLTSELQSKFRSNRKVSIFAGDYRAFKAPHESFKVVSNIPFALTSEILTSLMYHNLEFFNQGSLIMQLEPAQKLTRRRYFNPYLAFYHTFYELKLVYEINPESFMPPPTVKSALVQIRKRKNTETIGVEMKEKYLCFLFFMLKFPDLSARTALKKLFRKKQIRELTEGYGLVLENPISSMSAEHFYSCFVTMLKIVPMDYHPAHK